MHRDLESVLFDEMQIQQRVKELGAQISADYVGKSVMLICILKGAVVFFADLVREISVDVQMDFMAISSYGAATKSTGAVQIIKDLSVDITGMHVIVVEDIIDSGMSLHFLSEILMTRGAKTLELCTLLDKPSRRRAQVNVKYRGFEIPDEFVVGYGLDYAEKYRELPVVGILKPSVYGGEE